MDSPVRDFHVLDSLIARIKEKITQLKDEIKDHESAYDAKPNTTIESGLYEHKYNIDMANHFIPKLRANLATQENDLVSLITARGY
jgi:hypothetical protein